jgi:hypothetical protein
LGKPPEEWQPKWKKLRSDYGGDFGLREEGKLSDSRLEVVFNENVDEPELKVLLPVIKGLTILSPADRISVSEALFRASYGKSYHLPLFSMDKSEQLLRCLPGARKFRRDSR